MMNKYIYLLLIALTFVFLSCGRKNIERVSDAIVIAVDDKNRQSIEQNPIALENLKVIRLETRPDFFINMITRIRSKDSFILVRDFENELFLFDESGAFLNRIGRIGRGPGEYLAANDFYFDEGKIVVVDRQKGELLRFEYDGKFIGSRPVSWDRLSWQSFMMLPVDEDKILSANFVHGLADYDRYAYTLFSLRDKSTENFYPLPMQTTGHGYPFSRNPMSRTDNGDIHLIAPFDNVIYSYADGRFSEKYLIETAHPLASPKVLSSVTDFGDGTFKEMASRDFFTGFSGIFETQDHIFLNTPLVSATEWIYYLIDKRTGTGRAGLLFSSDNPFPLYNISGSTDTHFIGYTSISSAKAFVENASGDSPYIEIFRAALAGASDDDNPVLILYRWAI